VIRASWRHRPDHSPPVPGRAGKEPVLFPGVVERRATLRLSWAPDGKQFVFMSNGGRQLRLPARARRRITRITSDKGRMGTGTVAAHNRIAFVSGRSGKGDVYSLDLATKTTTRLTLGEHLSYPSGRRDASASRSSGAATEPRHFYSSRGTPRRCAEAVQHLRYDDLRRCVAGRQAPRVLHELQPGRRPKAWAIAVVAADGSDPTERGLAARWWRPTWSGRRARPAWMRTPRIRTCRRKAGYNPIYSPTVEAAEHARAHGPR